MKADLASNARTTGTEPHRARGLKAAGIAVILLGIAAAALPASDRVSSALIGALLVAAGMVESVAGAMRREARPFMIAAGCVTGLAGLLLVLNPTTHFFPHVSLVVAWLILRGLILAAAIRFTDGSVRVWTAISAGTDLLLGILLFAGLSIATVVVSVFGPTSPLVASFAWFLSASFIVNGLLLLEVSGCERQAADV
jgi:uncharacterized membrane protein HdeD (DUF308 family)